MTHPDPEPCPPRRPIRVAVTYRVCQGWRAPIFKRLADHPMIELKVFHGQDIPGTKLINAADFKGLDHQELKTYALRLKSSGRSVPALLYPGVGKHLDAYRPDVLLCEGGSNIFNNLLIYRWAKRRGVPTIWWGLGEIPGRRYRGLSRVYRWLRLRLMRRSTVLLGYSSRATDYFERENLTQPIFRAVNCVDTDRVFVRIGRAEQVQPPLRERMALAGKRVLLFVGAIEPAKRLGVLLRAYRRLQGSFDDLALVIVGDGSALPELRRQAESDNLAGVHFTGRVIDEVSEYFLLADVFVLPGLGGLAISEAMAHGLPVVCTTADGCETDLIQEGKNGHVIAEDDVEALADAIADVIGDPELCNKMGQHSKQIIERHHNVHTYLQGIVDAICCAHRMRAPAPGPSAAPSRGTP